MTAEGPWRQSPIGETTQRPGSPLTFVQPIADVANRPEPNPGERQPGALDVDAVAIDPDCRQQNE